MTLNKIKWDRLQARLDADEEREFRGHRDPGPPTRYVLKRDGLKHPLPGCVPSTLTFYLEFAVHDACTFSTSVNDAQRFDSATEAALFALQHCVTGVEVVPV
jgi:hypothetical protein